MKNINRNSNEEIKTFAMETRIYGAQTEEEIKEELEKLKIRNRAPKGYEEIHVSEYAREVVETRIRVQKVFKRKS